MGRPQLTKQGRWTAAVLSCGPRAVLSHHSAAALWGILEESTDRIEVSVPAEVVRRRPGIVVHRRAKLTPEELTTRHGIPVTRPVPTLVDVALRLPRGRLEAAINEADRRGLTDPEKLRTALVTLDRRPGMAKLRETLDQRTFTLTTRSSSGDSCGSSAGPGFPSRRANAT